MKGDHKMNRWLLKTEPEEYSWQDLKKEGSTAWDGVKAPAALKNMRSMKKGDEVFIYHSGKEKAVVGTGLVTVEAYPDPEQEDVRRVVVEIKAEKTILRPVTLADIKQSNLFQDWALVRQPRLSVVPVNTDQWNKIIEWGF